MEIVCAECYAAAWSFPAIASRIKIISDNLDIAESAGFPQDGPV